MAAQKCATTAASRTMRMIVRVVCAGTAGSPMVRIHSEYALKDSRPAKTFRFPIMCAIRYSTMMMPLTAITTFLKTELVFAALGALRRPDCVTVTTEPKVGLSAVCDQVNTG